MRKKILMTLALLLTAVTGAWADETPLVTINASNDFKSGSQTFDNKVKATFNQEVAFSADKGWFASFAGDKTLKVEPVDGVTITRVKFYTTLGPAEVTTAPFEASMSQTYVIVSGSGGSSTSQLRYHVSVNGIMIGDEKSFNYLQKIEVYGTAEPPIVVEPVAQPAANTQQWTFAQPGSDVVLTPIYSAATIYDANQTEKMAYETLKEAFANVQDGDVIKLDWNVTLTEHLETPSDGDGVKFTLDFNGYTIDGGTTYKIQHKNAGDQLTFTDSSVDQLGGLIAKGISIVAGSKFVFDAGRYNFSGANAETINGLSAYTSNPFSLAEGKEFVDLEGGAEANDGFMVRVGFKTFELTIGAGKFATFYMDQNITLADGTDTNIGLYTIAGEGINLANNTVTATKVNDPIAIARMPLLVYNGTTEQKTVTLKVTPVAPTAGQMWSEHFQGTAVDKTFDADDMAANDYFALSGGKAFAPVRGTGTIAKNKCWLEFAKQEIPSARQLTIVFDETTGVNEVIEVNEVSDDSWYDLNGRKIQKPVRKGVYIKNGQKKVVK